MFPLSLVKSEQFSSTIMFKATWHFLGCGLSMHSHMKYICNELKGIYFHVTTQSYVTKFHSYNAYYWDLDVKLLTSVP